MYDKKSFSMTSEMTMDKMLKRKVGNLRVVVLV